MIDIVVQGVLILFATLVDDGNRDKIGFASTTIMQAAASWI